MHRIQQRVPVYIDLIPSRLNLFRGLIALNEAQGVRSIRALTNHEKDFLRFARLQVNVQLQCGARIEPRCDGIRQANAVERSGPADAISSTIPARPVWLKIGAYTSSGWFSSEYFSKAESFFRALPWKKPLNTHIVLCLKTTIIPTQKTTARKNDYTPLR